MASECLRRTQLSRSAGSLFHTREAATQNALSPNFRFVRGTMKSPRLAVRRAGRPCTSACMQYSNLGLINDLYNCNISSLLLHRKVRLIIPNTALAAPAAFAHCLLAMTLGFCLLLPLNVEASCHTLRRCFPPSTNSAAYQRLVL